MSNYANEPELSVGDLNRLNAFVRKHKNAKLPADWREAKEARPQIFVALGERVIDDRGERIQYRGRIYVPQPRTIFDCVRFFWRIVRRRNYQIALLDL